MKTERVQYMRGILIVLLVLALVVPVQADKLDKIIGYVDTEIGTVDDYVDTEVAAIQAYTDSLDGYAEVVCTMPLQTLPLTTTETLFVFTGSWLILEVTGVITTVIQTGANNCNLSILAAAVKTDICAVKDIADDAAGNYYTITGTFANALAENAVDVPLPGAQAGAIRMVGNKVTSTTYTWYLIQTNSASKTGAISWSVRAKPLSAGATLISHPA